MIDLNVYCNELQVMTGAEMAECDVPDKLSMISYLSHIYDVFRGEIPHLKYPKMVGECFECPLFSFEIQHRL